MNTAGPNSDSYTLVTGATGAIGQHLLLDLLRCQLPVAVLVRPDRTATGRDRIEAIMRRFEHEIKRCLPRPVVIEANLHSEALGLSHEEQQWVAKHCCRVLHSAANLSFAPAETNPDNEPFRTNVDGTLKLVEICETVNIREFHYVSTAYVCGLQNGSVFENQQESDLEFANDYERSKARAEKLLQEAGFKSLTIYRPSIVVDPAANKANRSDQAISTAFSTYQLLASRFGLPAPGAWLKNLGLSGNERKNIVTAVWVARVIAEILRRPRLHGATYHLTSETGTTVHSLEIGFRNAVDSGATHTATRSPNAAEPKNTTGLLNTLAAPYVATFLPYFRDDPHFDQTNLKNALVDSEVDACPTIGVDEICQVAKTQMSGTGIAAELDGVGPTLKSPPFSIQIPSHVLQSSVADDEEAGLFLTGSGGGQWTVFSSNNEIRMIPGVRQEVVRRIYTTVSTLHELFCSATTLEAAFHDGRLLLEFDEDEDSLHWAEKALQNLRKMLLVEHQTADVAGEVVHVR